jgi:hemolysin activation/secretion protein
VRLGVKGLLIGLAICAGTAASAQDALDVTAPRLEETRTQTRAPAEQDLYIEFQPVLQMPAVSAGQSPVAVSAIVLDGLLALKRSEFADIIADSAGRTLSPEQLGELTAQIANRARERGYLFANAWIPPQSLVAGVLRIGIDEGVIDDIRIEGSSDPAISEMLAPLANGQPVSIAALERHVLLADDLPGVIIRDTRFEREDDRGILVVEAYRQDWFARASISSDGTKPQGPAAARINVDANGLLFDRDGVDLSISVTPFEPDELVFFSTRYRVVVNDAGTEVSAFGSYSRTEPGAYLSDLDIFGKSWRAGARLRHPLIRSRDRGLWLEGSLEVQDLEQDRFGALARKDRVALARLGAYAFFYGLGGRFRSRVTISQGLDILGATQTGDLFASRLDGEPDFTTLDWWINYDRSLTRDISLSLNAMGQFSTTPLLIGESLGLGGNFYIRGYDVSTRVGDQGVMGVGELRYDLQNGLGLFENMQIYAFADGGVVTNLENGFGGGSLASSGAGLRTDITNTLDFDLEVAVPLTGPRYDTDDRTPRLNVSLSKSF